MSSSCSSRHCHHQFWVSMEICKKYFVVGKKRFSILRGRCPYKGEVELPKKRSVYHPAFFNLPLLC